MGKTNNSENVVTGKAIIASTTYDRMQVLKASTSRRGFKNLAELAGGEPFQLENVVIFKPDESVEDSRITVALEVGGYFYSGIAADVIDVACDICAWYNTDAAILPLPVTLTKSSGKYGKWLLEIV